MIPLLVFVDTGMSKDIQCIIDDARMARECMKYHEISLFMYIKVPFQLIWMVTFPVFHVRSK